MCLWAVCVCHPQPALAALPTRAVIEHLWGLKTTKSQVEFIGRKIRKKKGVLFCFLNLEYPIQFIVISLPSPCTLFSAEKKPGEYLLFILPVPPPHPSFFSFLCYHHLINTIPAERAFQDFHPINRTPAPQTHWSFLRVSWYMPALNTVCIFSRC